MSDDKKIVRQGEILPANPNRPIELTRPTLPTTGAIISPWLKLRAMERVWDAYDDYLAVLDRVHKTNTALQHSIVENKRALTRLGRADEILEADRLNWQEEQDAGAHRRKMAKMQRDSELQQLKNESERKPDLDAAQHDVAMMRISNEKLRLDVKEADLLLEKNVINQEERNARIERAAAASPSKTNLREARQQATNILIARRGGEEYLTKEDKSLIASFDKIEHDLDDIEQDFSDG